MNDTERLARCAYWMGFLTGGLGKAIALNDWERVKELHHETMTTAEELFYQDYCLKAMNKSTQETIFVDKTKKCEHESDGSSHVFNYLDEKESFAMSCCKKCGAFYRPKKET